MPVLPFYYSIGLQYTNQFLYLFISFCPLRWSLHCNKNNELDCFQPFFGHFSFLLDLYDWKLNSVEARQKYVCYVAYYCIVLILGRAPLKSQRFINYSLCLDTLLPQGTYDINELFNESFSLFRQLTWKVLTKYR